MSNWDFAFDDEVGAKAVGAYVAEAIIRYDEYKANREEILHASGVGAAKAGRRPSIGD